MRSYNKSGVAGVATVKRRGQQWGGHEAALRWGTEEETELRQALLRATPEGEVWTAVKVAAWLGKRRGRKVHPVTGWRTLQRLRQSMQLPRPEHPEAASAEDQAAFQKNARDADGTAPGKS